MERIKSNIKIISKDNGVYKCFFEKEDLYSKLSGIKDSLGNNIEFIEIGGNMQLENQLFRVTDINLKFENIDYNIKHNDKTEASTPKNLIIETIITAEFIKRI